MPNGQPTMYELGFDKHLYRAGFLSAVEQGSAGLAQGSGGLNFSALGAATSSSILNPLTESTPAQQIKAGALDEVLFSGKTSFTDTTSGYRMGRDPADGIYKWIIGGPTSSADFAVTTADTFTVVGSITATSGTIGGWTITTGYIYDLTSGTPTAVPNNGVVLDSGNAAIITYEGTAERVRMGFLSAGIYGIRAFATDGTTVIFEASDTRQQLAGFSFTNSQMSAVAGGNTTIVSSGVTAFTAGPTGAPTFTVTQAGAITSTSGSIAAFTITGTTLSATNLTLTSGVANTANITVGTGATAGGINSAAAGGDIIFWGGDTFANRATAPFRVTAAGAVTASSVTLLNVTTTFQLASAAVTSDAGELNRLDGVSVNVTAANLSTLTGGTASDASSLHIHAVARGVATRTTAQGIGDQTVTHSMGVAPRLIKITAFARIAVANSGMVSSGAYTAAGQGCAFIGIETSGVTNTDATNIVHVEQSSVNENIASITATSTTTFTLNWSTFTDQNVDFSWEAFA